jgi:ADP-ribosylglycohydrolase
MKKITYKDYLDKVYGCFLGKTVFGTLGAPYEGIKMPMNLEFCPSMVNTMIPNDDLDLQILWLEVFEKKGHNFTSNDLLESFVNNCDYSPGEYAVMRKNFNKGIFPPLSGKFCNDFYREGMGSPIRSEIWACVAAGNPSLAAEYAKRDAEIDHYGESVYAEQFLAALEAEAFFESDLDKLINIGLEYVPQKSRIYQLIEYSRNLAKECDDYKKALFLLLKRYGHPDCTNLFENIGIVILCLYFGKGDFIKANMLAVNSGFDTDCTCATLSSIMGIIYGAEEMIRRHDHEDTHYVLSVRANRRSDSVFDLSEDISRLGVKLNADKINNDICIENAPVNDSTYEDSKDYSVQIDYLNDFPSIEIGGSNEIIFTISNNTKIPKKLSFALKTPEYITFTGLGETVLINASEKIQISVVLAIDSEAKIVYEKNELLFSIFENEKVILSESFGISCAVPWKLLGPFWKTNPSFSDERIINAKGGYFSLFEAMPSQGEQYDLIRGYHVDFHLDDEEFVSKEYAFARFDETDYKQEIVNIHEDSFFLDDLYTMQGATTGYLVRKLVAKEETEVCIQIGFTDPFILWINGEQVSKSDAYKFFTSENLHVSDVKLKEGINDILIRFTKMTHKAKFSLILSKTPSCSEHFTNFGSVNPKYF